MSNDNKDQVADSAPVSTENAERYFFRASAEDFKKIPGSPIAYWASRADRAAFTNGVSLARVTQPRSGMSTGNAEAFIHYWWEVSVDHIGFDESERNPHKRFYPHNKAGGGRRWFGYGYYVLKYGDHDLVKMEASAGFRHDNRDLYFQPSISWGKITSAQFGARSYPSGFVFDNAAVSLFTDLGDDLIGQLNSSAFRHLVSFLSPTLNFTVGDISVAPVPRAMPKLQPAKELVSIHRDDWDVFERSWDFKILPILTASSESKPTLESNYTTWITQNRETIAEMKRLEEENNRLFIEAYGLQDELTPEVPIEQITLTVNPAYRYKAGDRDKGIGTSEGRGAIDVGVGMSRDDKNSLLTPDPYTLFPKLAIRFREDTMKELISYAIGCMMGRYRLDRLGLIYAHSGNEDFWQIYDGKGARDEGRGASEKQREGEDLSGFDCVAEGDGVGGADLSNDQGLSERGTVRVDQSGSPGGSVNPVEYSGRTRAPINGGVSQFSVDSTGVTGRGGNAGDNSAATGVRDSSSNQGNSQFVERNIQNAEQSTQQIELTPFPSPLSPGPSVPNPFPPDDDGIVPVTDMDWFDDDAANRVREFLLAVWGPDTLDENMAFLAENLGQKSNETPEDTIRRYLSVNFFKDHLQTYKKRPIYWLFSSGKAKAFECLVYLHRYNEATLSRMRNEYVIPLQGKYSARADYLANEIEQATSASAQKKLQKEFDSLKKKQTELARFDEELRHYADQRIAIDLDDGVKVNYGKFGNLLADVKKVTGKK